MERGPITYVGALKYTETVSIDGEREFLEHIIANYFKENPVLCGHPIIRPYSQKGFTDTLFFSIPADNYCKLETFEKEIIKFLLLAERFGGIRIESGYINAFEMYRMEDPDQYKFVIKRKEADGGESGGGKLSVIKSTYKRDLYQKMKAYLRGSTPENAAFWKSISEA
jgi:hypothetical protein